MALGATGSASAALIATNKYVSASNHGNIARQFTLAEPVAPIA